MRKSTSIVDGNEAASSVAYRLNEMIAIYPEVNRWLDEHEYVSVQQMCGSMSHGAVADPGAFERGKYRKVLSSYTLRANAFND